MALIGMDAQAIRALATQVDGQAHVLNGILSAIDQLNGQLQSVWSGHDADEFHGWWTSQHRPALVAVESAIAGLATSARYNANAQDTASDANGSPGGGGSSPAAAVAGTAAAGAVAVGVASATTRGSAASGSPAAGPIDATTARAGYDAWYSSGRVPASLASERGECTSWAWYRTEQLGHTLPASLHGDGGQWARNLGGGPLTTPQVGSIASEYKGAADAGHVMVVENVQGAPGHYVLTVSEMNYKGTNEAAYGSGEQYLSTTSTLAQQGNGSWTMTRPGLNYHQPYAEVDFANP